MAKAMKLMKYDCILPYTQTGMQLKLSKLLLHRANYFIIKDGSSGGLDAADSLLTEAENFLHPALLKGSHSEHSDEAMKISVDVSIAFGQLYILRKDAEKAISVLEQIHGNLKGSTNQISEKPSHLMNGFSRLHEALIQAYCDAQDFLKSTEYLLHAALRLSNEDMSQNKNSQMDAWLDKYSIILCKLCSSPSESRQNQDQDMVHFLVAAAAAFISGIGPLSCEHASSLLHLLLDIPIRSNGQKEQREDAGRVDHRHAIDIAVRVLADEAATAAILGADRLRRECVTMLRALATHLFNMQTPGNSGYSEITIKQCTEVLTAAFHFSQAEERPRFAYLVAASYVLQGEMEKATEYLIILRKFQAARYGKMATEEQPALEILIDLAISVASKERDSAIHAISKLFSCPDFHPGAAEAALEIVSMAQDTSMGLLCARNSAKTLVPTDASRSHLTDGEEANIFAHWLAGLTDSNSNNNLFDEFADMGNGSSPYSKPTDMKMGSSCLMFKNGAQPSNHSGQWDEICLVLRQATQRLKTQGFQRFARNSKQSLDVLVHYGLKACRTAFLHGDFDECADVSCCTFMLQKHYGKILSELYEHATNGQIRIESQTWISNLALSQSKGLLIAAQALMSPTQKKAVSHDAQGKKLVLAASCLQKIDGLMTTIACTLHCKEIIIARHILGLELAILRYKSRSSIHKRLVKLEPFFSTLSNRQLFQFFLILSDPQKFTPTSITFVCDVLARSLSTNMIRLDMSLLPCLIELSQLQTSEKTRFKVFAGVMEALRRLHWPKQESESSADEGSLSQTGIPPSSSVIHWTAVSAFNTAISAYRRGDFDFSRRYMETAVEAADLMGHHGDSIRGLALQTIGKLRSSTRHRAENNSSGLNTEKKPSSFEASTGNDIDSMANSIEHSLGHMQNRHQGTQRSDAIAKDASLTAGHTEGLRARNLEGNDSSAFTGSASKSPGNQQKTFESHPLEGRNPLLIQTSEAKTVHDADCQRPTSAEDALEPNKSRLSERKSQAIKESKPPRSTCSTNGMKCRMKNEAKASHTFQRTVVSGADAPFKRPRVSNNTVQGSIWLDRMDKEFRKSQSDKRLVLEKQPQKVVPHEYPRVKKTLSSVSSRTDRTNKDIDDRAHDTADALSLSDTDE